MITLSPIKAVEARVRRTPGVISLAQGVPSLPLPETIFTELHEKVIGRECDAYLPPEGLLKLREALAEGELEPFDPGSEIFIANGAIEGVLSTLLTVCGPGDEVIMPTPGYTSFSRAISAARGNAIAFDTCDFRSGEWNTDRLAHLCSKRTRAILFSHPNNPTGEVLKRGMLEELIELARRRSLILISDETYRDFVWGPEPFLSPWDLPGGREVTVRISSFSKSFGVTGWRVGVVVAKAALLRRILAVHDTCVTCAPVVSQHLALLLHRARPALIPANRKALFGRLQRAVGELGGNGIFDQLRLPESGYYLFPRSSDGMTGDALSEALFNAAGVALVPGSAFGELSGRNVRLSVAADDDTVNEGIRRLNIYDSSRHSAGCPGFVAALASVELVQDEHR